MEKIIHINCTDLFAINKIDQLGNFDDENEIITTNFQHSLFSAIFMSGAEFIQLDKSLVDKKILESPFWKDKFIEVLTPEYVKIINESRSKLIHHLKRDENGMTLHPYDLVLTSYLGNLFYTAKTGIPTVMSRFKDEEDREWIKPAVTTEFYNNFENFHKLIRQENLDTLAPKYTALKKEIRIFEDITHSTLYRDYQNLHNELKFADEVSLIAKDIKVFALKLYYKYLGNFDLKKSTFGYIRETKQLGSIGIDLLEHFTDDKKINFYRFKDADFHSIFYRRMKALAENGDDDMKKLLEIIKDEIR